MVLRILPSGQKASAIGLEFHHQIRDSQIPLLLQMGQNTGSEEYFGLSNSVEVSVEFQGGDHVLASFFPIHKSLGYDIRREEFVALSELLERNPEK